MYVLYISLTALFWGYCGTRMCYLFFTDVLKNLKWLGFREMDRSEQMGLMSYGAVATLGVCWAAAFDGHNIFVPVFLFPMFFVAAAEFLFWLHRFPGPSFEAFLFKIHPVDNFYNLIKRSLGGSSSADGAGACTKPGCLADEPFEEGGNEPRK